MSGPDKPKDWFHGTAGEFDEFHIDWIGQGDDQLGSGFYFTDNSDTAENYARRRAAALGNDESVVLTAVLGIRKPLPFHARVTDRQIETILRSAPDFEETLQNFGDVGYEGVSSVLRQAVQVYSGQNTESDDDTLKMMFCMSNDFYRIAPADFLAVFSKVTGYDGLIRSVAYENHAVVWHPGQITVLDRRPVLSEAALRM